MTFLIFIMNVNLSIAFIDIFITIVFKKQINRDNFVSKKSLLMISLFALYLHYIRQNTNVTCDNFSYY